MLLISPASYLSTVYNQSASLNIAKTSTKNMSPPEATDKTSTKNMSPPEATDKTSL